MKTIILDYKINDKIIENCVLNINKNKKKPGQIKFKLNEILDGFYENELYNYLEISKEFINKLNKKNYSSIEKYINCLVFLSKLQKKIIFYDNYSEYILKLSECSNIDKVEFQRALKSDIQLIFTNGSNGGSSIKRNFYFIDDVLNKFYQYLSNTLFRNFIVIFVDVFMKTNEELNWLDKSFLLDILSKNRKINTLIKGKEKKQSKKQRKGGKKEEDIINKNEEDFFEKDILKSILSQLYKKVNIKGSSLFSNQLRFFGYNRIKQVKSKELSTSNESFDLNSKILNSFNKGGTKQTLLMYKKNNSFDGIIDNLYEIIYKYDLNFQDIKNNIHQVLRVNFKTDINKYLDFFKYFKGKNEQLFKETNFHISETIDLLLENKINEEK